MEDVSDTFNTEIRSYIVEVKGTINEMRNMLDVMNGRMKEGEEGIRDLEDRVTESDLAEKREMSYSK